MQQDVISSTLDMSIHLSNQRQPSNPKYPHPLPHSRPADIIMLMSVNVQMRAMNADVMAEGRREVLLFV